MDQPQGWLQNEDMNGTRFSFNYLPTTQLDASMIGFPLGVLYTPLKPLYDPETEQPKEVLPYEPLTCQNCRAAWNPYCNVNYSTHVWTCQFCGQRNPCPNSYSGMTAENPVQELFPQNTTIEYQCTQQNPVPPVFLFVIDTCNPPKYHDSLKERLLTALTNMPQNAQIGIITYGSRVYIHELVENDFPRNYAFSGLKTYTTQHQFQKANAP